MLNKDYIVDAPYPLDFSVDDVGSAPIAGDQWPVALLLAIDLVTAAIAIPLALLLLSMFSSAQTNSLRDFWSNVESDASFPVAIVIALALAGFYRSSRRARYESSFSELKELAVALSAGCHGLPDSELQRGRCTAGRSGIRIARITLGNAEEGVGARLQDHDNGDELRWFRHPRVHLEGQLASSARRAALR
jgi:hypothetical protein